MIERKRWLVALGVAGALLSAPAGASAANQLITIPIPDQHGKIPQKWITYPGPPRARVLLPDGYDPRKAYPLILLLHGFQNDYRTWSNPDEGDAQELFAKTKAIVAMPEAYAGWYADWWNGGRRGEPSWETYILDDVLPQIRQRYRIRPGRRWHTVLGVSMGGMGAPYFAGRLPGYFGAVGSTSGFLDFEYLPDVPVGMSLLAGGTDPDQIEGPPGGFYSRGHNPKRLVANLRHTRIYLAVGDGTISSRGISPGSNPARPIATEAGILRPMNDNYVAAARDANVHLTYAPHAGIHDWPDFRYDIRNMIHWGLFKPVVSHPSHWVNDTVATHGRLWGIRYRFTPAPEDVVHFRRAGRRLSVSSAGAGVKVVLRRGRCTWRLATPGQIVLRAHGC